ncbi:hypothetical protein TIFTF001_043620 [Ficus carica]|uniref:Uncharacterized protein n=1 Tax=Ficus carica TaxID=3494 RepID=A0AA87ZE71_FICCA|nr:hypothetical protein TIFTF001_043615 [Ficus carica]GMN23038.1 hypothetical protein TIFTF001_043620 [Ficus carica]
MMISRMLYVVSTRTRSGLVHGLSWTGLAAPTTPWLRATVSKLMTGLDTRQWSVVMQNYETAGRYRVGIRAGSCLPVSQYSCLRHCHLDARLWWRTQGELEVLGGSWENFCNVITARFGPSLEEDARIHYRDPKIYCDMNLVRYLNYVYDWHAYPGESMGHYCRRFQEAMLPHIPDLGNPEMRALQLLREGLPPEIKEYAYALVNDNGQEPVNDAGMEEPPFQWGPVLPEDPIPAMPLQEIPPQEDGIDADALDPEEFPDNPELLEDPPKINMDNGEDEQVDIEDYPEEIIFGDEDWDVFSDVTTE